MNIRTLYKDYSDTGMLLVEQLEEKGSKREREPPVITRTCLLCIMNYMYIYFAEYNFYKSKILESNRAVKAFVM